MRLLKKYIEENFFASVVMISMLNVLVGWWGYAAVFANL